MTLDYAQEAFRDAPANKTAGEYLATATTYKSDEIIGEDTFLNAVGEVSYWLLYGKQIG